MLQEGQDPRRMLVVTFTRNAAQSLVDDLLELDVVGSEDVLARTLHSYCFSLLHAKRFFQYRDREPRPLLTYRKSGLLNFEAKPMLDDLRLCFGDLTKRQLTTRIVNYENLWAQTPQTYPEQPLSPEDILFHDALLDWLIFHQSILIGEVIPLTFRLLVNNPVGPEDAIFDHVVVDEYQDLNRAEQYVIDMLAHYGNTTIVGDADQSIYSFRNANPEGMDDFVTRHPETHNIALNDCRRCPVRVVHMANNLIAYNHTPDFSPTINPVRANPEGEISVVNWKSIEHEAEGLSAYVIHLLNVEGVQPKDILIVSPRSEIASKTRSKLAQFGIEIESHFDEDLIGDAEAQRVVTIFTLLSNNQDRPALRHWLGHGRDDNRRDSYQILRDMCSRENTSPWDLLYRTVQNNSIVFGIEELIEPFKDLLNELQWGEGKGLDVLVEHYLPPDDLQLSFLREIALTGLEACSDMNEFTNFVRATIVRPERGETNKVRIMSAMKSKGLTSKNVIITTCIEGILPFRKENASVAERESNLREQRRQFYVAITRCKRSLVISSINWINSGFAAQNQITMHEGTTGVSRAVASRFIEELGSHAPSTRWGDEWAESGYS